MTTEYTKYDLDTITQGLIDQARQGSCKTCLWCWELTPSAPAEGCSHECGLVDQFDKEPRMTFREGRLDEEPYPHRHPLGELGDGDIAAEPMYMCLAYKPRWTPDHLRDECTETYPITLSRHRDFLKVWQTAVYINDAIVGGRVKGMVDQLNRYQESLPNPLRPWKGQWHSKGPDTGDSGVDLEWLREALMSLDWWDVGRYLMDTYPEARCYDNVRAMVTGMTKPHRDAFLAEVRYRLREKGRKFYRQAEPETVALDDDGAECPRCGTSGSLSVGPLTCSACGHKWEAEETKPVDLADQCTKPSAPADQGMTRQRIAEVLGAFLSRHAYTLTKDELLAFTEIQKDVDGAAACEEHEEQYGRGHSEDSV